jgi:hypothetical protein
MLNEAVCATINSVAEHSTVDVDISTRIDGTFDLRVRNNTRRTEAMAVPQAHPSAEEESGEADEENEDEVQPNADGSDQAVAPPSQPPAGIDVDAALEQAMDHARGHEGLLSVSVSVERSEVRADGTVVNYSKSTSMDLEQKRSDPPKLPDLPALPKANAGRAIGKYVSKRGSSNGFTPKVVFWNGKDCRPACHAGDCKTRPYFGFTGEHPTRCKDHAIDGMEDVINQRCEHPGCRTLPSFGFEGERRTRCKDHAIDGMEDVSSQQCEHTGCKTQPYFGFEGERPTRCRKHAIDGMEDVKHRSCEHTGCKTQPYFGFEGERPTRCRKHAIDGMEDVSSQRCEHPGCKTQPSFGFEGERPIRCKDHAIDGMEDLRSQRCEHPDCTTFASFPNKSGKKALCATHASEAGTIAAYNPRASKAACAAMDMLKTEGFADYEHEHINPETMKWEGREVEGLVAPRKHRPDGVRRNSKGEVTDVFFYHGNLFHGWPPEHEMYDKEVHMPRGHKVNNKERYEKTMADMQLFKDRGFAVFYLWEHHHLIARRAKTPLGCMVKRL